MLHQVATAALLRCRIVGRGFSGSATGQTARASSVNASATRRQPAAGDINSDLVVPASEILHERVPGDDHLCGLIGSQAAHRSKSVLELAVIGLDRIVGMPFDVMPRRRHQCLEHGRGRSGRHR